MCSVIGCGVCQFLGFVSLGGSSWRRRCFIAFTLIPLILALLITVDLLERSLGASSDALAVGLCLYALREAVDDKRGGRLRRRSISRVAAPFFSFSGERERAGTGDEAVSSFGG